MTTAFKDGVPSDSNLSVPQELIDYILDFLHDNVPTLRTCSLVSHAFLPCSRYHIYSNVFIADFSELNVLREQYAGQLYQCKNLAALLKHSPHVAPLVTRFGIHAMSDFMTEAYMDTSLVSIIPSLHNLSQIELMSRRKQVFCSFHLLRPFLASLRSIPLKTFIFSAIAFEIPEQFEEVFTAAANPALKHLSLICNSGAERTSEPYSPIRPTPDSLPSLESLSMAGTATSSNIAWLFFSQSLYGISCIRHLSLQIDRNTTTLLIQRLLNEMQGALESFTLDVNTWTGQQARLDLSRHRRLSSFFMIFGSPRLDPRLLEIHLNPTLRTLTVERACHKWERSLPHSVNVWAQVDAYLDKLALPALQSVHVRLHDSAHGICHCLNATATSFQGIMINGSVRLRTPCLY
ncbi:hypothetical protein EV421DRAFT_2023188 [Armillaria borealis]|uniref:F-box domain-containing protein n=1 Tax=Armillaria borealis TaxID=47425 RepID=A0AA39J2M1_9AGAR|nr:hypothetical protein EV421DRAFT_2023188 [Armillaria borealis]